MVDRINFILLLVNHILTPQQRIANDSQVVQFLGLCLLLDQLDGYREEGLYFLEHRQGEP